MTTGKSPLGACDNCGHALTAHALRRAGLTEHWGVAFEGDAVRDYQIREQAARRAVENSGGTATLMRRLVEDWQPADRRADELERQGGGDG